MTSSRCLAPLQLPSLKEAFHHAIPPSWLFNYLLFIDLFGRPALTHLQTLALTSWRHSRDRYRLCYIAELDTAGRSILRCQRSGSGAETPHTGRDYSDTQKRDARILARHAKKL